MSRVIFDIETVGYDFDSLEPAIRDYLIKWNLNSEEIQKIKESLSFYPLTGQIVAIGMLNPDTNRGRVYFQAPYSDIVSFEEEGILYKPTTEDEMLRDFWDAVKSYDKIITFNGRAFDCPFIIIRSAIHRIKPTRELMPYRYADMHLDLFDQLTFYGSYKRRFSLDIWCRVFNIKSPKSEGITGLDVKRLFHERKYIEIAKYCAKDLYATKELLFIWENYIKFKPNND
ncbi:MAG: ribonuclease H-like domain-containing protein [Thermodesulfovibrionales bacterium]|nr:ribonuclease H-like domain-containing protein [Thermodesulfovibrionales bacterium]